MVSRTRAPEAVLTCPTQLSPLLQAKNALPRLRRRARRCAFAEPVEGGESTVLCQNLARKWNMVRPPLPPSLSTLAAEPCWDKKGCSRRRPRAAAAALRQVVVNPILERDEAHCDVVWNTAVVISNSGRRAAQGCQQITASALTHKQPRLRAPSLTPPLRVRHACIAA